MDGRAAIVSQVKGFLIPEFRDEQTGMAGLWPADFEKVRQGYACARCLAEFITYTFRCPVCGLERDLDADVKETPALWSQVVAERAQPTRRTPVAKAEDALAHLASSPDVERIPLSGLERRNRSARG